MKSIISRASAVCAAVALYVMSAGCATAIGIAWINYGAAEAQTPVETVLPESFTSDTRNGNVTYFYAGPSNTNLRSGELQVNGNGNFSYISVASSAPTAAIFHQVVDRYFDADGKEIEVKSATHTVDPNCHPGLRRQSEQLIVRDDGKGNVQFGLPSNATEVAAVEITLHSAKTE